MRVVGIDASSTATGMALFVDDELVEHYVIVPKKTDSIFERINYLFKTLNEELDKLHPDVIAVEDTWFKANPQTAKMLARIGGGIWFYAITHGVQMYFIAPGTWRSVVGLSTGNKKRAVKKAEAIAKIEKDFGFTALEDEAEAILIAQSTPILLEANDLDELFE